MSHALKKPRPVTVEKWTCPTCAKEVGTAYCPRCGECALQPRELTFRGMLDQVVQAVASIDGPLLRSLRCLITRPGVLTVAYLQGQRKPYRLPLQLFFVANVAFFAAQSMIGARIFSTSLEGHLHNQAWSGVAQRMLEWRLGRGQMTQEGYAPVFDQAVALNAKSLIVLMVPPFALLPPLLFRRKRLPFVGHLVFSLHFYAFLLLLLCVALAAVQGDVWLGGAGLESEGFDHALSVSELAVCAAYLFVASGKVYGDGVAARLMKVVPLVLAVAGIFLGYRFVVMVVTLATA